jgi:2-polyprenyl-6-methoxyphenol hydroxylase-like FAD-dependent oxidoreductase
MDLDTDFEPVARAGSGVPPRKVTIVGGGIGGLAVANALQRVGIDFDLYEQAPELTEVGAGIGLSKGALDLLDAVGLGAEVRANGSPIRNLYLADKRLRVRRKLPANYNGFCIHRALLIDILKSRLPMERIHLSRRVTDIRSHPDRAELVFDDGSTVASACTVAADGIHSALRTRLFPGVRIRYIDQTIWRGITRTEVPELLVDSYIEIWDEGLRFLTVPINSEDTFWLAVKRAPPGLRDDPATVRDELLHLFRNFHPACLDLIRNSRNFLRNDMGDLGSVRRPWHQGRIVFVGDAIHATTPNLAQGGCQAIEDAVCLALCLASHPADLERAFRTYQRLRQDKVAFVVNTSWRFGVAAHARNPLLYHLARAVLERSPAALLARQERYLSDLAYLREVDAAGVLHESAAQIGGRPGAETRVGTSNPEEISRSDP